MKIKRDFVTNSSSTSFIVTCKAAAEGKDEFIDKINGVLREYIKDREWDEEFQAPPMLTSDRVISLGPGEFIITDFVPIYSNDLDTPQYIKDLFGGSDSDTGKLLEQAGIKIVTTEMKDLNK